MTLGGLNKINDIDKRILDDNKVSPAEAKELNEFLGKEITSKKKTRNNLDLLKNKSDLVNKILLWIELWLKDMIEKNDKNGLDVYEELVRQLDPESGLLKQITYIDLQIEANRLKKEKDELDADLKVLNITKKNFNSQKLSKDLKESLEEFFKISEFNWGQKNVFQDKIDRLDLNLRILNDADIKPSENIIKSLKLNLMKVRDAVNVLKSQKSDKNIDTSNYLSKPLDAESFEKAEYEQAFDQCFLEDYKKSNPVELQENLNDWSFGARIAEYSESAFPKISGLTREANFIIVWDGKNDNGDLQNLYPAGTKLIQVTAKIGDKLLYKQKDNNIFYTLDDHNPKTVDKVYSLQSGRYVEQKTLTTTWLLTESPKIESIVIAFGEDEILNTLRADRFQEELDKGDDSKNDLFKDANAIKLDDKSLDLSVFEKRWSGAFEIWLSGQETDKINANLPKIFGAVDKLDWRFLDALVDVILEKSDTHEYLIQTAINWIFEGGSFHKNRLWKTDESVSKNYQKLQNFIIKKWWLENGSEAEKEMAIKVFSLSSQLTKMTPPKTFQERIGEYAKVLFEHPVGKMILSLIDSMFGGKWNFLKWVSKRDKSGAIVNEINEQFKKNYSLSGDQMKFLNNEDNFNGFDEENEININDWIQKYNEWLGKVIKNLYLTQSSGSSKMDSLAANLANQWDLLDPKVLSALVEEGAVIKIQDAKWNPLKDANWNYIVVNHNEVFVTDAQWWFKVNPNITADTLKMILQDARIQSAVINANTELIKQGQERKKDGAAKHDLTGNSTPSGIQTEKDYAKFLTAYLMGWSKWEWKFQYVITENNLSNAFPPVENSKNGERWIDNLEWDK